MGLLRRSAVRTGRFLAADFGIFAVVAFAAFVTRLLPLSTSPYPFNNDGLTEAHLASNIIASGHLTESLTSHIGVAHSEVIPILNVVTAFVASALGVSPFMCAQVIVALLAIVTVGGLFLLGRMFTGSTLGGMAASFPALFFGTFVFTTGSFWKETLGFSLLVLVIISFVRRNEPRYRLLCFILLMVIPLVHHLVAAVTLLAVAFPLAWSWRTALKDNNVRVMHVLDLTMAGTAAIWTMLFYSMVSFDRFVNISSPTRIAAIAVGFGVLCIVSFLLLSMKSHSKLTFAPLVGAGLIVVMAMDYFGFLFDYKPSAQVWYFALIAGFAFILSLAWYGTEITIESVPRFRALQLGLLLSPLALVGYGMVGGLSPASHQLVYRTFDFVDIFMFLGCAVGIWAVWQRRKKAYCVLAFALVASSLVSFPFAYDSELLGVRHDSQGYEVDAIYWISDKVPGSLVVTDERLGYMTKALAGNKEEASLASLILDNITLSANCTFIIEDSWTTEGVNVFPLGLAVIPQANLSKCLSLTNVMYVGGPVNDHVYTMIGSPTGPYVYNSTFVLWETQYHRNLTFP